jgi:peptidoglycan/LPS O-acetylase OafA/YrhL
MVRHHHNNVNLLRAIAVITVFAHHFTHYTKLSVPWVSVFGGQLGVQLFFLVSGYLIVQSAERLSWQAFLVNRVFRIFPVYWVVLVIVSLWVSHTFPLQNPQDWPYFLINFLALGHFVPYALSFDVLTVSWTLTVEWSWYLLVLLLLWGQQQTAVHGLSAQPYWLGAALGVTIISIVWMWLAWAGQLDWLYASGIAKLGISPVNDALRFAFIVVAAPAQWGFFMLGVLLWVCAEKLRKVSSLICLAVVLALLAKPGWWNLWLPSSVRLDPSIVTGIGLAAVFLLVQRLPVALSTGFYRKPLGFLQWIGDVSYPIYLIHVPIIVVVFSYKQLSSPQATVVCILILFAAAAMLHLLVELPGRKLGARLLGSRVFSLSTSTSS